MLTDGTLGRARNGFHYELHRDIDIAGLYAHQAHPGGKGKQNGHRKTSGGKIYSEISTGEMKIPF